jgi:hypothetical protein
MRRVPLVLALVVVAGCTPPAERAAVRPPVVDVWPVPAARAVDAGEAAAACVLEGDGEPLDRLFFHEEEPLLLFGARGDAEALVRIDGRGRYTLHGRWSDLSGDGEDGRARLVLERAGSFRLAGFSLLHATRFRLRRRTALVADHVWLEPDYLVSVTAADGPRAKAIARLPFDAPKERALEVPCADLAYDDLRERVRDPELEGARAHVDRLALHDVPGGALVFAGGKQLFFVVVDEERDGFARIRGERHGIRFAGWTPSALVSRDPQGAGDPGGSRSGHGSRTKGKPARVTRTTALHAERGGTEVVLGQLEVGTEVRVLESGTGPRVAVELAAEEVRALPGVSLRIAESDLESL